MLNYIQAEFYKLLHRKYTYIALGILLALEGIFVAGFAFHNAHSLPTPFGNAVHIVPALGAIGYCVCLFSADIVFAAQYKNSTLKNEVSFGLSRTRIYLGKLIVQILLSTAYMVAMLGFYVGACAVILPLESAAAGYTAAEALVILGYFLAAAFPLWVGAQAATCMCVFLIHSDMAAACASLGLTMMLNTVVELVGLFAGGRVGDTLIKVSRHMPGYMIGLIGEVIGDPVFLGKAWIVGLFWVAVSTAVGMFSFHSKEIK